MNINLAQIKDGKAGRCSSYDRDGRNRDCWKKEIKVTIEHGHGNHLANEMSSVAYWYADMPARIAAPPPVAKRMPVLRDNQGRWLYDRRNQCPGRKIKLNPEMKKMKTARAKK